MPDVKAHSVSWTIIWRVCKGQAGACLWAITRPMPGSSKKNEPILTFRTAQDLEAHLAAEPRASKGFWLKLSKAGAAKATISKGDAIEVALCWGWIDGQLDRFDDQHFLVRMTPRRAQPPNASSKRWMAPIVIRSSTG